MRLIPRAPGTVCPNVQAFPSTHNGVFASFLRTDMLGYTYDI